MSDPVDVIVRVIEKWYPPSQTNVDADALAVDIAAVLGLHPNPALVLWVTPTAIREAFADGEDDPTIGMTDDELTEVGYEVLDGIYDEYRRLLDLALEDRKT